MAELTDQQLTDACWSFAEDVAGDGPVLGGTVSAWAAAIEAEVKSGRLFIVFDHARERWAVVKADPRGAA